MARYNKLSSQEPNIVYHKGAFKNKIQLTIHCRIKLGSFSCYMQK